MYVLKRRAKRAVVQATFRALVSHRCAVSPGCQSPNPASAQVNNILGYLYALVLISIYDSYVSEYHSHQRAVSVLILLPPFSQIRLP